MKPVKVSLKREYDAALSYYKQTVWKHVEDAPLTGVQYDVALLAFERLRPAQRRWQDSLALADAQRAREAEPALEQFRPRRLQHDEGLTAEFLATLAATRLGTRKPQLRRAAIEEAHQLLATARDYLNGLPRPPANAGENGIKAAFNSVSFAEIEQTLHTGNCVPLMPPVQAKRNKGALTSRAIEMALKRHGEGLIKQAKSRDVGEQTAARETQKEIRQALKDKVVSCLLLEEIRWDRFRRHFKG